MYSAMYEISETIKLATELLTRKGELKQELPYHINVIDELHINENGHSRILTKLLKYKNPAGHFPLLESLLLILSRSTRKRVLTKSILMTQLLRKNKRE